jgi:hypothetical protein
MHCEPAPLPLRRCFTRPRASRGARAYARRRATRRHHASQPEAPIMTHPGRAGHDRPETHRNPLSPPSGEAVPMPGQLPPHLVLRKRNTKLGRVVCSFSLPAAATFAPASVTPGGAGSGPPPYAGRSTSPCVWRGGPSSRSGWSASYAAARLPDPPHQVHDRLSVESLEGPGDSMPALRTALTARTSGRLRLLEIWQFEGGRLLDCVTQLERVLNTVEQAANASVCI